MSQPANGADGGPEVRKDVHETVREGEQVRSRVSEIIEEATTEAQRTGESVETVVREAMEGARTAVDEATEKERAPLLRDVIDGIADGFESAANATRLAVEEAAGQGRAYAEEDMKRTAEDLRTIGGMFVDTVRDAVTSAGDRVRRQADDLADHARRASERIRPSLEDAARTAASDPIRLAGETAKAGVDITRQAAGSLFTAIGDALKKK